MKDQHNPQYGSAGIVNSLFVMSNDISQGQTFLIRPVIVFC